MLLHARPHCLCTTSHSAHRQSHTSKAAPRKLRMRTPQAFSSSNHTLLALENIATSSSANVYDQPLKQQELQAFRSLFSTQPHLMENQHGSERISDGLLEFCEAAAEHKDQDLSHVHGAMVACEVIFKMQNRSAQDTMPTGIWTPQQMRERWELVVGADVGDVQYIPVVEVLQVAEDTSTMRLDGDTTPLIGLFLSFSGDATWISNGHLQYKINGVRIELRRPAGFARAAKAWKARSEGQLDLAPDRLDVSNACQPDPTSPGLTIPLPFFPANELFVFASNKRVACSRSKLGGLILLKNQSHN